MDNQIKTTRRYGIAVTKYGDITNDEGQKYIVDEHAKGQNVDNQGNFTDNNIKIPDRLLGKVIETEKFVWEELDKVKVTRHYLAPFNPVTRTQKCSLCGEIIHDYSNAMYAPNPDGSPVIEKGWLAGEHYIWGINPQQFTSVKPTGNEYNIVLCSVDTTKTKLNK